MMKLKYITLKEGCGRKWTRKIQQGGENVSDQKNVRVCEMKFAI